MRYVNFRAQIKSGDVLAWTHRGWKTWDDIKSQLVRLFTQSEYSHVGIAVVMGGRVWVLEAVTPRVRLVPLSNLLPCYHLTGYGMSDEQIEAGLALVCKDNVVYSQCEAIKAFFGNNDPADGKIECAELVSGLLDLRCRATPSAVVEEMLANGSNLTEVAL